MQPFSFSAIAQRVTVSLWLFLGRCEHVSASFERTASHMANQTKKKGQANGQQNGSQNGGERKPPAHEIKYGLVRVSIWRNDGQQGPWFSTTVSRRFLDAKTNEWRTATSFGRSDLLTLALALNEAARWIYENPANKSNGDSDPEPQNDGPQDEGRF